MTLIHSDNLRRDTAESRGKENSMPEFSRFQKSLMICMVCQCSFQQFKGMTRRMGSSVARCPTHQKEADERRAIKEQAHREAVKAAFDAKEAGRAPNTTQQ